MNKQSIRLSLLGLLIIVFGLLSAAKPFPDPNRPINETLKEAAFQVLNTKCNVCHRKKNPFMVFKLKNMEKRAERIYQAVFVSRRMPKGDDIQLTENEYTSLRQWLQAFIEKP
ncbi:MAG: hypothetical protein AAF206_03585 [Bacteroidota bacterium]